MTLRVLHVQRVSGIGGSERHLLGLLPSLARAGLAVRMAVLATGDAGRFVQDLEASGVAVTTIPAGPDLNPVAMARLARLVRSFHPDLVHTHLVHADVHGQAVARLCSVPGISSFHASPPLYGREPVRTVTRATARLPRLTIAISEHLVRFLVDRRLVRPDRVRLVHYGIDSTGWRLSDEDRAQARRTLGLEPSEVAVGIASRLVADKGHADLIDAFADAVRRVPRLRLLVAGVGRLRHDLEQRAHQILPTGSYRFLGFVEDIRPFLAACDVFAFPTTPDFGEGFGMAALEASAAGRPVIGTAVGPIPEVVADGTSGIIVPPRSTAKLADALAELASDRARRELLGAGGARRAREVFGLDGMVEATVAVYREAVGAGEPRGYTPPGGTERGRRT